VSFVVFGMPRSRTAWLSRFLTYGDWICGHEEIRNMRSVDDLTAWFSQPCTGTVETAASPWWRTLDRLSPGAKIVVVRRPVDEVVESFARIPGLTLNGLRPILEKIDTKLRQIEARIPGALSVSFAELAQEETCAKVFEHCLPYTHDTGHWQRLAPVNIQINMHALMRHFQAYQPALDKLSAIVKHQTLSAMALHEPVSSDGMVLQTEDFESWLRDAENLFDAHLVQVGEAPGNWQNKNIPMMRRLYDAGAMQITTARCNGRMFGYLMTLLSPSLTSKDIMSAVNTTFYASPDFPGLGLKIQRAALGFLKQRGVDEVFFEAGKRGSGDRISAIYRRIGAQDHGQVFRLQLAGV
jgi:hypothetical protein